MTGPEFRTLRLRMGISLTQLAIILRVVVSTICRYQSGALTVTDKVKARMLRLERGWLNAECDYCGHARVGHRSFVLCEEYAAMPVGTTAHAKAGHAFE